MSRVFRCPMTEDDCFDDRCSQRICFKRQETGADTQKLTAERKDSVVIKYMLEKLDLAIALKGDKTLSNRLRTKSQKLAQVRKVYDSDPAKWCRWAMEEEKERLQVKKDELNNWLFRELRKRE